MRRHRREESFGAIDVLISTLMCSSGITLSRKGDFDGPKYTVVHLNSINRDYRDGLPRPSAASPASGAITFQRSLASAGRIFFL